MIIPDAASAEAPTLNSPANRKGSTTNVQLLEELDDDPSASGLEPVNESDKNRPESILTDDYVEGEDGESGSSYTDDDEGEDDEGEGQTLNPELICAK
mmetsp:Transcript_24237/g.30043  ORF Transcript_24237/g.30043 Transcript_24237/m.30043 type:complete len:98 (-) Transcript_24237:49-342(-)|eukprot:CAMPEP_0170452302 /NCGR_PEP_ID=MMETSP0123-20130129/1247_1 /TAXON_ID=182087 /ORGANISM="Favella ehrenbergii, Strain Fehren 1" /LENGTH=97 /DNA_ID=CAMNT_0010714265 /DNA_START=1776 /DNA_END=2069 /DNA_ORIENTATION=+